MDGTRPGDSEMSDQEPKIDSTAAMLARQRFPKSYLSGSGGPWCVIRDLGYGSRVSIIFFESETEARLIAEQTGGRLECFRLKVPKIKNELGWE